MSKITVKDAEELRNKGVLSKTALEAMEKKGFVSKKRENTRRFVKTADGKWVEPMMYFRGGKNTKPSNEMTQFQTEYNTLLEKYTVTRSN